MSEFELCKPYRGSDKNKQLYQEHKFGLLLGFEPNAAYQAV